MFEMDWKKSTLFNTWTQLKFWFHNTIENGYEEDSEGNVIAYPLVEVVTEGLPQQVVIGIMLAILGIGRGTVNQNGLWFMLWYCAPREEEFIEFCNQMRLAEHNYPMMEGI